MSHLRRELVGGQEDPADPGDADVRQAILRQITENDRAVRMLRLPGGDTAWMRRFPFASASLLWLIDEGGTRSTILAHRAGVTKQATSQLMRLMERQGYLEQVPDPTDTRAKVVRMTARGEEIKTACVEVREELNRMVSKALGVESAERLAANLDAAASLFGQIAGTGPQSSRPS